MLSTCPWSTNVVKLNRCCFILYATTFVCRICTLVTHSELKVNLYFRWLQSNDYWNCYDSECIQYYGSMLVVKNRWKCELLHTYIKRCLIQAMPSKQKATTSVSRTKRKSSDSDVKQPVLSKFFSSFSKGQSCSETSIQKSSNKLNDINVKDAIVIADDEQVGELKGAALEPARPEVHGISSVGITIWT